MIELDLELCERLKRTRLGEGYPFGQMLENSLINPDGPEAAARIAILSAELARMREALAQWKCGACGGSGIYLNRYRDGGPEGHTLVTQEATCTVCGGTGQHPTARAALSGETK